MKRTKIKIGESGVVLIVCMFILLMLSLIGIASITTSDTDVQVAGNEINQTRAFYLAEAGIEKACTVLKNAPNWRNGFENTRLGRGIYNVKVIDSDSIPSLGSSLLITSTGISDQAQSRIEVTVSRRTPFRYAAFGKDYLSLGEESMVDSYNSENGSYAATRGLYDGNIGSNGNITIDEETTIYGNVTTSLPGGLNIEDEDIIISGDTSSTVPEVVLDSIPPDNIENARVNNLASTGLNFFAAGGSYNPISNELIVNEHGIVTLASGTYYFSSITMGSEDDDDDHDGDHNDGDDDHDGDHNNGNDGDGDHDGDHNNGNDGDDDHDGDHNNGNDDGDDHDGDHNNGNDGDDDHDGDHNNGDDDDDELMTMLMPEAGATVIIYVTGDISCDEEVLINPNGSPSEFQIYSSGNSVTIGEESVVKSALYAPYSQINIAEETELYGSFIGRTFGYNEEEDDDDNDGCHDGDDDDNDHNGNHEDDDEEEEGHEGPEEIKIHYDRSLEDINSIGRFYISGWSD